MNSNSPSSFAEERVNSTNNIEWSDQHIVVSDRSTSYSRGYSFFSVLRDWGLSVLRMSVLGPYSIILLSFLSCHIVLHIWALFVSIFVKNFYVWLSRSRCSLGTYSLFHSYGEYVWVVIGAPVIISFSFSSYDRSFDDLFRPVDRVNEWRNHGAYGMEGCVIGEMRGT